MPAPFLIKKGQSLTPARRLAGRVSKAFLVIVVSKKVAPLAVKRNLIKRRTRHIFRELKSQLKPQTRELVIIYHPGASQLSFTELKSLITADLKRQNYV